MCVELVCEGNFLLILENFLLVGEDFLQVELGSAWLVVVLNLVAGPWGLVHLFVCQPKRAAGRSAPEGYCATSITGFFIITLFTVGKLEFFLKSTLNI